MDWQLSVEEALTRLEKGLWCMANACHTSQSFSTITFYRLLFIVILTYLNTVFLIKISSSFSYIQVLFILIFTDFHIPKFTSWQKKSEMFLG